MIQEPLTFYYFTTVVCTRFSEDDQLHRSSFHFTEKETLIQFELNKIHQNQNVSISQLPNRDLGMR